MQGCKLSFGMWLQTSDPRKPSQRRVRQHRGSGSQRSSRGRGLLAGQLTALQPQPGCWHTGKEGKVSTTAVQTHSEQPTQAERCLDAGA